MTNIWWLYLLIFRVPNSCMPSRRNIHIWAERKILKFLFFISSTSSLDDKKNVQWLNIHELVIVRSNLKSFSILDRSEATTEDDKVSDGKGREEKRGEKSFDEQNFFFLLWQVFNNSKEKTGVSRMKRKTIPSRAKRQRQSSGRKWNFHNFLIGFYIICVLVAAHRTIDRTNESNVIQVYWNSQFFPLHRFAILII